jgi:hypothetical protein
VTMEPFFGDIVLIRGGLRLIEKYLHHIETKLPYTRV